MKVAIIGGVAGGATAAARLRRLDESAEIIIFERSGYVSYANCGLPYYIGGEIKRRSSLTLQTPKSFKERFNIDVRVNSEVIKIDRARKKVTVKYAGGVYEESYDKLIYSPGARPILPDGAERGNFFPLRTVEDTFAIDDFISGRSPKSAIVAGGGFIGLEAAENLVNRGISVTLIQGGPQVLPQTDYDIACFLHAELRRKGIKLVLSSRVTALEGDEGGVKVLTSSGGYRADFAVVALGVAPDTSLAEECGLQLGIKKAVVVDGRMRTSDPDIYAVGDAVQIKNCISGQDALISLAGPANKQGRIAADNICGMNKTYRGGNGSSVIKVFDLTCAFTGLNTAAARRAGIDFDRVVLFSANHATYYPGARNMTLKVLFERKSGRITGAQAVGYEGVDKRIDVLAAAMGAKMTAYDLQELDLAYAPPYSSAKDPVNMAGYVIEDVLGGIKQYHWEDLPKVLSDPAAFILDVRTAEEFAEGHFEGAVNIPVDELRARLGEIDGGKTVYVNCHSGLRSYIACRILMAHGFDCFNFSGGYRLYAAVKGEAEESDVPRHPCGIPAV